MKRARVIAVAGVLVMAAVSGCGSHKKAAQPPASPGPGGATSPAAATNPPVGGSPSASASGAEVVPSEYSVIGTSVCGWEKKNGVIRLTAAFSVTYAGTAPAVDVTYMVTDDQTHNSETGTVIASMLGSGTSTVVAGVSAPGFSTAAGEPVTLTITIQAIGDTDTTNNSAIETMTVPEAAVTAKDTSQTLITCDGP